MERKEGIVLFHESRQQRIGVYTGILCCRSVEK